MIVFEKRASIILFNLLKRFDSESFFLIPANICPIVPATFLKAGKKFEFVDISTESLCVDKDKVINKIQTNPNKYKGLIFVRTYGYISDYNYFFKHLKEINKEVFIIDDRCLAEPKFTEIKTEADVILYSTGYSKFTDIGFGGFAIIKDVIEYKRSNLNFNSKDYSTLCKEFRNLKPGKKYNYNDSDWLGDTGGPMDIGDYKKKVLQKTKEMQNHKKKLNRIYTENLPKKIQLEKSFQNWRFNLIISEKEKLLKKIFENGLFASSHYQSLAGIFDYSEAKNAENLYSRVINLFNDFRFNEDMALKITDLVKEHISNI